MDYTPEPADSSLAQPQQKFFSPSLIKISFFLIIIAVATVGFFSYYKFFATTSNDDGFSAELSKDNARLTAYRMSLIGYDAGPLKENFANDVANGINDKYTKSDAYFITHRYFDNGNNIYEVYDYVNSYPSLSFLKEAEVLYPEGFEKIRKGEMSKSYSSESLYAYLAYLETVEKHGYADIAAISTLANQYSKNAYYNLVRSKETTDKALIQKLTENIDRDTKKGLDYTIKAQTDINSILNGELTSEDIPYRGMLVGLNQYAASVRYLKALGKNVVSPKTSEEIFLFARNLSDTYVPELRKFTALLDATTLALFTESKSEDIKVALQPILDFDIRARAPVYIVQKILNSKEERKDPLGLPMVEMYSKKNVVTLAGKVPEFKEWLLRSGWTEADLRY